jgi:hypothetical protein
VGTPKNASLFVFVAAAVRTWIWAKLCNATAQQQYGASARKQCYNTAGQCRSEGDSMVTKDEIKRGNEKERGDGSKDDSGDVLDCLQRASSNQKFPEAPISK